MESEEGKGFPPDVIVDILSRLPLKSLVRFRCVSKLWLHTLTHSRFPYWLLSLHLHCDPLKDCNHKQPSLILQFPESSSLTKLFSIGGNHHDDAFKVGSEIDFPLFRGRPFEIKSTCCDGMVCLAAEVDSTPTLVLWNPALRDYKVLPLPSESRVCEAVCGLGFDSSMDDYKVVSVSEGQAFSFSLKRNCWRIIGDFGYHLFHHGLAANGCLYWPAGKSNSVADRILRLNLSDDVFSEVRLHSSFNQPSSSLEDDESLQRRELRLFLKGNLLCVFREYDQSLWAMKEDRETGGVARETWKKLMTIPKFRNREIHFQIGEFRIYHRLYPKCFTKSGKLLFCVKGEKFVLYDPKELHYEALHICGLGDGPFSNVIAYTESLISPDSIRGMNDID